MRNRFSVLTRLFNRTDNRVIATLYSHCIGRPLLIEPNRGEALLGAYMQGAVDEIADPVPHSIGKVAVLNISGALASRPMPGPSGPGPMNYEEISDIFGELVERSDVDAIVLRLDSPGGFADGLLDLTDQIKAARAEKPVHAVVEHMAFSAGYAIAAAAERIWVTRTGGVGSVGTVMYHVDQSAANEQEGLKVTAIYAGARKVDFSPHFELSEDARKIAQAEIDKHYGMFVDAIADYRGMSADAVRATEAALYMGADGVNIGFADAVGTLTDAIAFLVSEPDPTLETEDETMTDKTDVQAIALAAQQQALGAIAATVMSADLPPALQATLLKCDLKEDEVEARVDHAKKVHSLCQVSECTELAATFVSQNTAIDDVRTQLTERRAQLQPEIDVTLPVGGSANNGAAKKVDAKAIYESRRKQAQPQRG